MLMPVKLHSFTHLSALLVLHDRGISTHATGVTGHYSSN
jgi:2-iminoacetate synthase ThiH